jgi:multiple sugar transport system ATP-binding protein
MAAIALQQVSKLFPDGGVAARDLTLEIADGELLVLLGPSGSGKSTVLRLIAGLEEPTSGRILIGGRDVTRVEPRFRDLAMVFQSYALYPHKTVRENLAFGLRVRGVAAARIQERVQEAAAMLGIEPLLERRPAQLSGGQRQRVALGRAVVREPQAFLLDEPLSNLDPQRRVSTRAELALLHRRLRATMVYVTHDQEEAMTLGTRIAVTRDGSLEQLGAPLEVYERPANTFVAGFVGSPAMNLWPGTWTVDGRIRVAAIPTELERQDAGTGRPNGQAMVVGIRPHDIEVTAPGDGDARGRVEIVEPLGAATLIHVQVDGLPELARVIVPPDRAIAVDDQIGLRLRRDRLHLFDATGVRV